MTRTIARNRVGLKDAITVDCSCGHRLALLDEVGGLPNNYVGQMQWVNVADAGGAERWYWYVKCPRCGTSRKGNDAVLLKIIRHAKARGLQRVTLSATTESRPHSPGTQAG